MTITLDEARAELQILNWDNRLGTFLCLEYILENVAAEHGPGAADILAAEWAKGKLVSEWKN